MIASDVMTRNVISVPPDATVADAVALMLDRSISGLLVVPVIFSPYMATLLTRYSSNGQRIYYTGADETGTIPRSEVGGGFGLGFGRINDASCIVCPIGIGRPPAASARTRPKL